MTYRHLEALVLFLAVGLTVGLVAVAVTPTFITLVGALRRVMP